MVIVLPMAAPGLLTSAIFCFIIAWNEFLFALILTNKEAVTLPIGFAIVHPAVIVGKCETCGGRIVDEHLGIGVMLTAGASDNQVEGNLIGTNSANANLGNGDAGVFINGPSNTVGGNGDSQNRIWFNLARLRYDQGRYEECIEQSKI